MTSQSPHNQTLVTQSIVILDFGAQYSQLIARRIREQNVFSVVLPCTAKLDEIKSYSPVGIVLSGAPWSVYDKDAPPADARVFELGLPVLGICYGLQFMVHTLGAKCGPRTNASTATRKSTSFRIRFCFRDWRKSWPCGCRTATKRSNCLRASS